MGKGNILLLGILAVALVFGINAGGVTDKIFGSEDSIYYDFNNLDLLNQTGLEVINPIGKGYTSLQVTPDFFNKTFRFAGDFGNLTNKELEEYAVEMRVSQTGEDNYYTILIDFDPEHDPNNLTNYNARNSVNYEFSNWGNNTLYSNKFSVNNGGNSYTNLNTWVRANKPKVTGDVTGMLNIKFNNVAKYSLFATEVDLLNTSGVDKNNNAFEYYSDEYFDTSDLDKVLDNAQFIVTLGEFNSLYPFQIQANNTVTIDYIKLIK